MTLREAFSLGASSCVYFNYSICYIYLRISSGINGSFQLEVGISLLTVHFSVCFRN